MQENINLYCYFILFFIFLQLIKTLDTSYIGRTYIRHTTSQMTHLKQKNKNEQNVKIKFFF